ncbi:MAG: LamG-like jellyroll fold domain-containing protein [Roseibacillus sp.]
MRYAIFSDVHANRQAWKAVLADTLQQRADTLVCLGDVVGYGPKPLAVLTAVREVTPNFVLGNHDAAACGRLDSSIFNERARIVIEWTRDQLDEEALQFLEQVPLQMDGSEIQFVHAEVMEPGEFGYVDGIGSADLNLKAMTSPIGFLGHTHLPMAFTMPRKGGQVTQLPPLDFDVERGRRYLVNVGSVGEPRTTDVRASYVIYDDVERRVYYRKVAFDVEAYKADLAETGLDFRPYFVQVVDAGKVAGTPAPTPAPQMALAQPPKVAEVVAGHLGRLVVGTPGSTMATGAGAGAAVAQPKSISGWVIGAVVLLVLLLVGMGVMIAVSGNDNEDLATVAEAGTTGEAEKKPKNPRRDALVPRNPALVGKDESAVPIKGLQVRQFAKSFKNLGELRRADEKKEQTHEEEVEDGLLNLVHGGEDEAFGLVWEGSLVVPETGEYEFILDAASGAAVLLYWEVVVEQTAAKLGDAKSTKVRLRKGHAPFRVEYFHRQGDKGLAVSWSGPGLEGEPSLVRAGHSTGVSIARKTIPDPGEEPPPPVVKRTAPEKISQDLLAYWSFDDRDGGGSRFVQASDGSVTEKLVAAKGQRVQVLAPRNDPGKRWTSLKFDAKAWEEGLNGVGYEDVPGEYKDLIATKIMSKKGEHPHSVFVRIPFKVEDPGDYEGMDLYMRYDDGFVAYLNGSLMASKNAPNPLRWNSAASAQNSDKDAVKAELFKVNRSLRNMKKGWNILAVQVLNGGDGKPNDTNTGCTSSDLLLLPELVALRKDNTLPDHAKPKIPSRHDRVVGKGKLKGKVKPSEGKFGEAYAFEEGSIEIGQKNDFGLGDESFTVSLWFTRDPDSTDGQARRLISAGGGGEKKAGWALWLTAKAEGLSFAVSDGSTRSTTIAKEDSLANGEWHHVVATVDRGNGMVFIFLDGELVADQRVSLLEDNILISNSGLSIGRNSDDKQHHRGKLDDIAVWHRALLPEEVEKVFESGKGLGEVFNEE